MNHTDETPQPPPRRSSRRRAVWATLALTVVAACGSGTSTEAGSPSTSDPFSATPPSDSPAYDLDVPSSELTDEEFMARNWWTWSHHDQEVFFATVADDFSWRGLDPETSLTEFRAGWRGQRARGFVMAPPTCTTTGNTTEDGSTILECTGLVQEDINAAFGGEPYEATGRYGVHGGELTDHIAWTQPDPPFGPFFDEYIGESSRVEEVDTLCGTPDMAAECGALLVELAREAGPLWQAEQADE